MHRFLRLIAVFTIYCLPAIGLAQPKLSIVIGDTYDWGTVTDVNTPLTAKIELKNIGTQELIIDEVKPGCGCTTAPLEKKRLMPDESTFMNVTLNVGPSNIGQVMKNIYIYSNSVPYTTQTLIIKAFIQRPLQPDPIYMTLPPLTVGKETQTTFKIKNTQKKTVTLLEYAPNNKAVVLTWKKSYTFQPEEEVQIPVKIKPTGDQIGYFQAILFFKTDHPDQKQFEVNMYGNVAENPAIPVTAATNTKTQKKKSPKQKIQSSKITSK